LFQMKKRASARFFFEQSLIHRQLGAYHRTRYTRDTAQVAP
jgi:hypothetical protein